MASPTRPTCELSRHSTPPLVIESITPSQGSCSGTRLQPGHDHVRPGACHDRRTARSADGFDTYPSNTLLNNTATVSAPVGIEMNPDDNSASATISTVPWAETSIDEGVLARPAGRGGPVTYTMTVHSDGPGTVDLVVADILPAALVKPPMSISISGGTGICQFDPTGESIGFPPARFPIVGCEIPQFGPGEDRVITIESTLASDSAGTQVDNLALSSNTLPGAGVSASSPTSPTTRGPCRVVHTARAGPAARGPRAHQGGAVRAGDCRHERHLPADGAQRRAAGRGGGADRRHPPGGARVRRRKRRLDGRRTDRHLCGRRPGRRREPALQITVRPSADLIGQTLTNTATVGSATTDPDTADNAASAPLTIVAPPLQPTPQTPPPPPPRRHHRHPPPPGPPPPSPPPPPPASQPPPPPPPGPPPAEARIRCAGRVATLVGTPRRRSPARHAPPGRDRSPRRQRRRLRALRQRRRLRRHGRRSRVRGAGRRRRVFGGPGPDLLVGGPGNDRIFGGGVPSGIKAPGGRGQNDTINGGAGAESLFGGAGPDRINGGRDRDFADGGQGGDRCRSERTQKLLSERPLRRASRLGSGRRAEGGL